MYFVSTCLCVACCSFIVIQATLGDICNVWLSPCSGLQCLCVRLSPSVTLISLTENTVVSTEKDCLANRVCSCVHQHFLFSSLSLQPSLLRAIFNVDPDEVRSLIFKKEDVNIQVGHTLLAISSDILPI